MDKNIYSVVLSDSVVEAVDDLARSSGLSRSAMINRILAERVAYTTPEMRMQELITAMQTAISEAFYLPEQQSGSTFICRSTLKYRYKPTAHYSVEFSSHGGKKVGELKVLVRSQNTGLNQQLDNFFRIWAALEQKYLPDKLNGDIVYRLETGKLTRTLNMPQQPLSNEELGTAAADYISMLDSTMKLYFSHLPDERAAAAAAVQHYMESLPDQKYII